MGNREALLRGAKQCIYERGYARTTARDVATAAGVSLAAIGYHFGTIETLLNKAMIEAIGDWGDEMERALIAEEDSSTPQERFAAIWMRVIDSFAAHRPLWAASFQVFAQIDHAPEVRAVLAEAFEHGRSGLVEIFGLGHAAEDDQSRHAVGALCQALMTGLLAQWLVDPARAPTGTDLAIAWKQIAVTMALAETRRSDVDPDAGLPE